MGSKNKWQHGRASCCRAGGGICLVANHGVAGLCLASHGLAGPEGLCSCGERRPRLIDARLERRAAARLWAMHVGGAPEAG
eukprot:5482772-Lingulodinium_polyedra.AAC.1